MGIVINKSMNILASPVLQAVSPAALRTFHNKYHIQPWTPKSSGVGNKNLLSQTPYLDILSNHLSPEDIAVRDYCHQFHRPPNVLEKFHICSWEVAPPSIDLSYPPKVELVRILRTAYLKCHSPIVGRNPINNQDSLVLFQGKIIRILRVYVM